MSTSISSIDYVQNLYNDKSAKCREQELSQAKDLNIFDFNNDGSFGSEDLVWLSGHMDFNSDGKVDAKEASFAFSITQTISDLLSKKIEENQSDKNEQQNSNVVQSTVVTAWSSQNKGDNCLENIIANHYEISNPQDYEKVIQAVYDANPQIYNSGRKTAGGTTKADTILYTGETVNLPDVQGVAKKGETTQSQEETEVSYEDLQKLTNTFGYLLSESQKKTTPQQQTTSAFSPILKSAAKSKITGFAYDINSQAISQSYKEYAQSEMYQAIDDYIAVYGEDDYINSVQKYLKGETRSIRQ